jgi:hypothetical protein
MGEQTPAPQTAFGGFKMGQPADKPPSSSSSFGGFKMGE